MHFSGSLNVKATPEALWATFHDENALKKAFPELDELEKRSDTEFWLAVSGRILMKTYRVARLFTLTPIKPGRVLKIRAKGYSCIVKLEPGTISYTTDVSVNPYIEKIEPMLRGLVDREVGKYMARIDAVACELKAA